MHVGSMAQHCVQMDELLCLTCWELPSTHLGPVSSASLFVFLIYGTSILPQPLQLAAADGLPSRVIPMTSPECSRLRQQSGLSEPAGSGSCAAPVPHAALWTHTYPPANEWGMCMEGELPLWQLQGMQRIERLYTWAASSVQPSHPEYLPHVPRMVQKSQCQDSLQADGGKSGSARDQVLPSRVPFAWVKIHLCL